jgi:ABC-type transporter Mla subunit MlaD
MKPNYFKIGIFVIMAVILIIASVTIFGSGLFGKEKLYFETYFDTSISGLNVGAPVENLGVRIGKVEKITFVTSEYEFELDSDDFFRYQHIVMVLVSLDTENLPAFDYEQRKANLTRLISNGLRIRLASNLLTGQGYLQCDYIDPNRFDIIEPTWEPEHLYVPSAPGEFSTLKQSVDKILFRLEKIDTRKMAQLIEEILNSIVQAFDDANIPELSNKLQDLFATTDQAVADANLGRVGDEMYVLLSELRQTNRNLDKLLSGDNPEAAKRSLADVIDQLQKTMVKIDRFVSSQGPQTADALDDLRQAVANLKDLVENLKRNPSSALFGKPPDKLEIPK